jgi:hypothetical protein
MLDKDKYLKSLNKLDALFREMSSSVTEVSKWRCPYKNVDNGCTAKFRCRNQEVNVEQTELYLCVGSDNLDYRSAWET